MPTIVISGVNLVEGGTLKILQDCLRTVKSELPDWRVIAIVNNERVVDTAGVETIVLPEPKKSWLKRIYAEYFTFNVISKSLNADIWWSIHDMSPRVVAKSQFVYCHNPDPFHKFSKNEIKLEPKLLIFSLAYSFFYRLNIHANRAVIVQQEWMRREFKRRYQVGNVVVAHPVDDGPSPHHTGGRVSNFVYPSLARAFKNFELIGDAVRLLEREPDWNGRVIWTISPDESRLTRRLHDDYGDLKTICFAGRQDRAAMTRMYGEMDCLLFPSRLETWGLPISETKSLGKPMIVADLPYAHETVGTYDLARFVDPADPRQLADAMLEVHRNGWSSTPVRLAPIAAPFADNWPRLVQTVVALHEARTGAFAVDAAEPSL